MFILRTIEVDGTEINTSLGKEYVVIKDDHKDFPRIVEERGLAGSVKAIIFDDNGKPYFTYHLAPSEEIKIQTYIMTESGQTFCKL